MIPSTFIGYNTQKKNKIYTYNSIDGSFTISHKKNNDDYMGRVIFSRHHL
jgi:hypothetical protein